MRINSPFNDIDLIKQTAKESNSIIEILRKLNLSGALYNYNKLKKIAFENNIELPIGGIVTTTHFLTIPLDNLLIEKGTTTSSHLKKRLLKENRMIEKCIICNTVTWLSSPLTLHLDHINGDPSDNRIENLRLLCPNCHSQTSTYAGKNIKRTPKVKLLCLDCNSEIAKGSTRCIQCAALARKNSQKIDWPSVDQLKLLILKFGNFRAGQMLGVSDNAIKKHLTSLGIDASLQGRKSW